MTGYFTEVIPESAPLQEVAIRRLGAGLLWFAVGVIVEFFIGLEYNHMLMNHFIFFMFAYRLAFETKYKSKTVERGVKETGVLVILWLIICVLIKLIGVLS